MAYLRPETLAPGELILVVRNQASFQQRYPSFTGRIAGQYEGKLDNAGELIRLRDALGTVIHEFTYSDAWYPITDGEDFSLTIRDPQAGDLGLWNIKAGWRPSVAVGGSPGFEDGAAAGTGSVVINELLALARQHFRTGLNCISPVHYRRLVPPCRGDEASIKKYEIPTGTFIPAGSYMFMKISTQQCPGRGGLPFLSAKAADGLSRSGLNGVIGGYQKLSSAGASLEHRFGRHLARG